MEITDGTFSLAQHREFLSENTESIESFQAVQSVAFAQERARWEAGGA